MTDSSLAPPSLLAAFIAAQQAFPPIKKSKENKHFGSRYADLSDVNDALIPVLNMYGFAVMQPVENGELVTKLVHAEGTLTSSMPLNFDAKPQELGSQLSYVRRYALCALCGVTSEDDDDGNAASSAKPKARTAAPTPSDGQLVEFNRLCDALGIESNKDKAGFITAAMGDDSAKWAKLDGLVKELLIADLRAIATGEKQLVYDNAGRPSAAPLGEPFDLEPAASGGEPQ